MKFAIISDIHFGSKNGSHKTGRKIILESKRLTNEFVDKINYKKDLDFVVNLGDSI